MWRVAGIATAAYRQGVRLWLQSTTSNLLQLRRHKMTLTSVLRLTGAIPHHASKQEGRLKREARKQRGDDNYLLRLELGSIHTVVQDNIDLEETTSSRVAIDVRCT